MEIFEEDISIKCCFAADRKKIEDTVEKSSLTKILPSQVFQNFELVPGAHKFFAIIMQKKKILILRLNWN